MSHYDILEVSPKASAEVIRAAYKSLMQRHHPDKNAAATESTQRATSIAQAYEVLSDPHKRQAYDQTLLARQPEPPTTPSPARRSMAAHAGRRAQRTVASRVSAWYGPLLVLSIILAGAAILLLSKKKGPDIAPSRATVQSIPAAPQPMPQPVGPYSDQIMSKAVTPLPRDMSVAATDDGQTMTIIAFATDLSVELTPDTAHPDATHALRIPDLGLRLSVSDPDRWVQKILAQRSLIMQRILIALATAKYRELIKPEGDLYLKRLIEDSLTTAIGLDPSSAAPADGRPTKDLRPVEALLPASFSAQ